MNKLRYCSFILVITLNLAFLSTANAVSPVAEIKDKLPDNNALEKMTKGPADKSYLDSLYAAVSGFQDYQCICHMMSVKGSEWKDYGGAKLFFKKNEKIRAEIMSSDYRNGAVVVKQGDGKIRGKGGGGLSLVKMTIQPDSRQIKLPTGFSLAECDFLSLYGSLKQQMADGAQAAVSQPISLPSFKDPVQILLFKNSEGILHVIYLNPKTKSPILWNTFEKGQSHAMVLFDKLDINPGLSEDLFHL